MNDNKIPEQTMLLAEAIIKLAAIERLLVKNDIITSDDIVLEMKKISSEVQGILAMKDIKFNN